MSFLNKWASETKYLVTGRTGSISGKKQIKKLTKLLPFPCSLKVSLNFDGNKKVFLCWTTSVTTVIFSAQWNNPIKWLRIPSKFSRSNLQEQRSRERCSFKTLQDMKLWKKLFNTLRFCGNTSLFSFYFTFPHTLFFKWLQKLNGKN